MSDSATATATPATSTGTSSTASAATNAETTTTVASTGKDAVRAPGDGKEIPGTEGANGKAEAAKAVQDAIKKWKLKAGDQDVEVDEAELVRRAQLGFGAEKKIQDAAKVMKEWNQMVSLLKDPKRAFDIFKHPSIGLDPMKVAEELIFEKIKMEQLTPEQREALEWKQKAMTLEEEKKAAETEAQKLQAAKMEEHFSKEYETKIISTLEKAGLPKSRTTVARMAQYMLAGLEQGVQLAPEDVVDLVRKKYMEDIQGLFGGLDGEKLLEMIGEDVAKKIRTFDLNRPKVPVVPGKEPLNTPSAPVSKKKLSKEEWRAHVERAAS
jgi:hypothetical protein